MRYNMARPFFPDADIRSILHQFGDTLKGKGVLTMGPHVREFEAAFARYTGSQYAVATNSCTSALEIALSALGVGRGNEVLIPVQTFIATGSCVLAAGARVVFCNVDQNFLMDFEDLKKKINRRTKAVILVHFAGLIHPQLLEIKAYLKKRNIYLIEDAAHACGAKLKNRHAGTFGDIGCFSFFSTKVMTTGEGGMITTDSKFLFGRCSSMRNRGLDLSAPREQFSLPGSNRRMSEVQGILGNHQLKRLESFVKHRNLIAGIYKKELRVVEKAGKITFQQNPKQGRNAYWKFVIFLKNTRTSREALKQALGKRGVAIDWPYAPLLHLQPLFKKRLKNRTPFARSEALARTHFCLPIHMGIKPADAKYIARLLIREIH